MVAMYLGKADVNTYDKGVEREFLVSNGAGSYGFSTVVGANTRMEHGLLVVRSCEPSQHTVLVSKLEETVYAHNKKYQLSTNRYRDLIYPDGYRYLQEYQGNPIPSMLFVIHSIFLKKSIFMPLNGTSTIIRYELLASPEPLNMDLRPLVAHRSNNAIPQKQDRPDFEASLTSEGVINVKGRGHMSHVSFRNRENSARWFNKPLWFENLVYERDGAPDNPALDYLWSPGFSSVGMKQGDVLYVVLSEEPVKYSVDEIEALERESLDEIRAFVEDAPIDSQYSAVSDMVQSSYHLVADQKDASYAIFSGFPSVEQRARDTFVAFPGLTLATGRGEIARGMLDNWLKQIAAFDGVVPALIDCRGDAKLGDMDAGLWFLYAVGKYVKMAKDDFDRVNWCALEKIVEKYIEGDERLGVVMDPETKLLKSLGDPGVSHWMSGEVDGELLVERRGYLVEMGALWYNALRFMARSAERSGNTQSVLKYERLASECRDSFEKIFWNEGKRYLYDWVDPVTGEKDPTIRPNAIFSVSLPDPSLPEEKGRQVFSTCWNELYTTYGLRTLDPHHDKFKGRAEGRPDQKKKARLRGMAWPWLLGHFITAFMRYNPGAHSMGWSFVRPFSSHLRRGCLGGVAEYFDGVMPYKPNGDVLSAMSLGELLRAIHEDLTV